MGNRLPAGNSERDNTKFHLITLQLKLCAISIGMFSLQIEDSEIRKQAFLKYSFNLFRMIFLIKKLSRFIWINNHYHI